MILQTHRIDINHFIPYHEQKLIADVPGTKMETQLWMSEEQHITLETKIIPNKIKCFDGKSRSIHIVRCMSRF